MDQAANIIIPNVPWMVAGGLVLQDFVAVQRRRHAKIREGVEEEAGRPRARRLDPEGARVDGLHHAVDVFLGDVPFPQPLRVGQVQLQAAFHRPRDVLRGHRVSRGKLEAAPDPERVDARVRRDRPALGDARGELGRILVVGADERVADVAHHARGVALVDRRRIERDHLAQVRGDDEGVRGRLGVDCGGGGEGKGYGEDAQGAKKHGCAGAEVGKS